LTAEEQATFRRLAVFSGGCALAAAEAVDGGGGALDRIAALVDASLLHLEADPDGAARYRMLENVRELADERLAESGEEDAARLAHARYFLELAERHHPTPFLSTDRSVLQLLEAEHGNLRAALAFLQATGRLAEVTQLIAALGWFWFLRGQVRDARPRLEWAIAQGEAAPVASRIALTVALGLVLLAQGEQERAETHAAEGLALARAAGDALGTAQAPTVLGVLATSRGEYDHAVARLEEVLVVALARRPAADVRDGELGAGQPGRRRPRAGPDRGRRGIPSRSVGRATGRRLRSGRHDFARRPGRRGSCARGLPAKRRACARGPAPGLGIR
jgi:hypothetical protein